MQRADKTCYLKVASSSQNNRYKVVRFVQGTLMQWVYGTLNTTQSNSASVHRIKVNSSRPLPTVRSIFPGRNNNPLNPHCPFPFCQFSWSSTIPLTFIFNIPTLALLPLLSYSPATIKFGPIFLVPLSYYWEEFSALLMPPLLHKWRLKWIESPTGDAGCSLTSQCSTVARASLYTNRPSGLLLSTLVPFHI